MQVKVTQELKTTHTEQLTRLHFKHQSECDLLEDMRWAFNQLLHTNAHFHNQSWTKDRIGNLGRTGKPCKNESQRKMRADVIWKDTQIRGLWGMMKAFPLHFLLRGQTFPQLNVTNETDVLSHPCFLFPVIGFELFLSRRVTALVLKWVSRLWQTNSVCSEEFKPNIKQFSSCYLLWLFFRLRTNSLT